MGTVLHCLRSIFDRVRGEELTVFVLELNAHDYRKKD